LGKAHTKKRLLVETWLAETAERIGYRPDLEDFIAEATRGNMRLVTRNPLTDDYSLNEEYAQSVMQRLFEKETGTKGILFEEPAAGINDDDPPKEDYLRKDQSGRGRPDAQKAARRKLAGQDRAEGAWRR
jgi:hypothetical protein